MKGSQDVPQAEDMEMKAFVVRSDAGNKPSWLKLNVMKTYSGKYDTTDEERLAHQFGNYDEAQGIADDWSDVPGVWRVERV